MSMIFRDPATGNVIDRANMEELRKTVRWTPARKSLVVLAVRHGVLTAEQAQTMYLLSPEELERWEIAYGQGGRSGVRVTHYPSRKSDQEV